MSGLKRYLIALGIVLFLLGTASSQQLKTPAEAADYQKGGTLYEPLMDFVYTLESKSEVMNVKKVTETLMGRDVVLCILSDPPVYNPADIDKINKPVVLIVNNVHGGEVAGKDASLELMRDLVMGELRPLLEKVVVLNIPTINPDGAELYRRTNEQNYDMNRDYLKLESQEIHGLITDVINEWHPDIHVDTHHGGSVPYTLTYQTCMNPAGDPELIRFGNEEILPRVRAALRKENYDGFWYSSPRRVDGEPRWYPTSVEPRKQHVYSTLANMIGFLYETPSGTHRVVDNGTKVVPVPREERYRHQVRGEYIGQRELIRFAAENGDLLKKVLGEAKIRALEKGSNDSDNDLIPIKYEQVEKFKEEFWIRKQNGGSGDFEKVLGGVYTKFVPTRTAVRPWGYLMPPELAEVIPLLMEHEISVERLIEPAKVEVEVYYAKEIEHPEYFQGHYLKEVKAEKKTETIELPAGSFFIPAGQQKSNLICYILEPETNDNLITWGYLDDFIQVTTGIDEMLKEREDEMRERMAEMTEAQKKQMEERMQRQRERYFNQRIPIYRVMKKTGLKGVLIQPYNEYERNRYGM